MTDIMDPHTVEEQSQAEQENYKVYKRRWLVLFAMFNVTLVVGLHRCLISVEKILLQYLTITQDDYDFMTQISMFTILITVFFMARGLDYFGLRRMAYVACTMIICANSLKALCCCDEKYVTPGIKKRRYHILLLSEFFVGLANSIALCVPAKVASAWFAHYESTLALVIATCGSNVGVGFSNYFTPIFIQSIEDIYKLSYLFLISGCVVTFIVLTSVTRSSPKMPPSSNAIVLPSTIVPLRHGIALMLTNSDFILLIITLALNQSVLGVEQLILDDILTSQGYDNNFCGTLIAHSNFFGTFFMLMAAAWIDNSVNYVKVSRISSMICALSIVTFNMSILVPNIKSVILVTNILAAFGCSLMYPALFQVCIRGTVTILPEATVSAIVIVALNLTSGSLMNMVSPLKRMSPQPEGYQAPMVIFACILMIINILYTTSFRAPSREQLHARLQNSGDRTLLVDG